MVLTRAALGIVTVIVTAIVTVLVTAIVTVLAAMMLRDCDSANCDSQKFSEC